jgi:Lon protease-like protein
VTDDRQMEIALFPLHSVLLPGVALPLHIFEERYRLMIGRCIERREPFGVVLIREGRETGAATVTRLAAVGTTAHIRQASRYADGRMDIVTVGTRRFHIDALHATREPYVLGEVTYLDEPLGERGVAHQLSRRVGRSFLRYLELLQPALASDDGPEIEVEIEIEAPDDTAEDPQPVELDLVGEIQVEASGAPADQGIDTSGLDDEQRRELLMAAARRLTATSDPTELSYLISGLVQVELAVRQELLEAVDTTSRLSGLDAILRREIQLLSRQLKPIVLDPRMLGLRRN